MAICIEQGVGVPLCEMVQDEMLCEMVAGEVVVVWRRC